MLLACAGAFFAGCSRRGSDAAAKAHLEVQFAQGQPAVGANSLTLHLTDHAGRPISLTSPRLEGDMNHAGMKPVFGNLQQPRPGEYTGTIDFTMGGDWILLVSGQTADGGHFETKVDVPGVKAK